MCYKSAHVFFPWEFVLGLHSQAVGSEEMALDEVRMHSRHYVVNAR